MTSQDLIHYADETPLLLFTIVDQDGNLIDLTGLTITMYLHKTQQASSAVLWQHNASPSNQIAYKGQATLQLQQGDMILGQHYWSVLVSDGNSINVRVVSGLFTVKQ